MKRTVMLSLIVLATALLFDSVAAAAPATAPKRYNVVLAYFTATPKPLKPGQARSANLAILPADGANFALDVSTPVRFRKQMESVSREYDYTLDLAGSVVCESGAEAQTELRILPAKTDPTRLQMTGLVWASQLQPHLVKLALQSIGVFVSRPGVKEPVKVFSLDATKTVVLGRTYVAGYQVTSKDKNSPISLLAVCVQPAS